MCREGVCPLHLAGPDRKNLFHVILRGTRVDPCIRKTLRYIRKSWFTRSKVASGPIARALPVSVYRVLAAGMPRGHLREAFACAIGARERPDQASGGDRVRIRGPMDGVEWLELNGWR